MRRTAGVLFSASLMMTGPVLAQDESTGSAPNWDWGILGGAGYFSFENTLFVDTAPDPSGDLSDDSFEGHIKPWVSAEWDAGSGTVFGKASSFILARNEPGRAVEAAFGRTEAFNYGMLYLYLDV